MTDDNEQPAYIIKHRTALLLVGFTIAMLFLLIGFVMPPYIQQWQNQNDFDYVKEYIRQRLVLELPSSTIYKVFPQHGGCEFRIEWTPSKYPNLATRFDDMCPEKYQNMIVDAYYKVMSEAKLVPKSTGNL